MAQSTPQPRTRQQRKADTLHRLEHDEDLWVATADPETAVPYLVPLSFLWDGAHVVLATPGGSQTARNLTANGRVRLALGPTRDLVLIEGTVEEAVQVADVPGPLAEAFPAKAGFDPRKLDEGYVYLRIAPQRIQAWREVNELTGRLLMRAGEWL